MTCSTPRCRNRPRRTPSGGFRARCCTCESRRYAEKNPARIKFLNLRKSAKRRGVPFTLTWDYFEKLALLRGYTSFTDAKDAATLSVDRLREDGPYSDDNVDVIPLGDNSRKAQLFRKGLRMAYVPYFAAMSA